MASRKVPKPLKRSCPPISVGFEDFIRAALQTGKPPKSQTKGKSVKDTWKILERAPNGATLEEMAPPKGGESAGYIYRVKAGHSPEEPYIGGDKGLAQRAFKEAAEK